MVFTGIDRLALRYAAPMALSAALGIVAPAALAEDLHTQEESQQLGNQTAGRLPDLHTESVVPSMANSPKQSGVDLHEDGAMPIDTAGVTPPAQH